MNEEKNYQNNKKILDEYFNETVKESEKRNKGIYKILNKLWRFKTFIIRFSIFAGAMLFLIMVFSLITRAPRYSDKITKINSENFEKLIQETGEFEPKFQGALEILKEQPNYYKKVVNNIKNIKFQSGRGCQYMCMGGLRYTRRNMGDVIFHEGKFDTPTLIINPKNVNTHGDEYMFASALIHEADHAEYIKSGRIRKTALMIKCNPLINPNISINSYLPDLTHRITPIEICAEKEEIKFHKAANTYSGYETGPFTGAIKGLWLSIVGVVKIFIPL